MDARARKTILRLNRQFYQTFGAAFAEKRGRLQPGVSRLLARIPPTARVLDLGCGHGMVARALAQQGFQGEYVGIDFSPALLAEAQSHAPKAFPTLWLQRDLADPHWSQGLNPPFDVVCAFAVLHHLPDRALREQVVRQIGALLRPGGLFCHSHWNFLRSPRLRARIQPWGQVGLHPTQVDPGDHLLDWRHRGLGLRYVHHFTPSELTALAQRTGFRAREMFLSDGEGGRLGLYAVWERPSEGEPSAA